MEVCSDSYDGAQCMTSISGTGEKLLHVLDFLIFSICCLCTLHEQWNPSHLRQQIICWKNAKQMKEGKHCGNAAKYTKRGDREETPSTTVPSTSTPEMLNFLWNHDWHISVSKVSIFHLGKFCSDSLKGSSTLMHGGGETLFVSTKH